MSRLALTPTNTPALASNPTTPSARTGDLYYNTGSGLMVYDGSSWVAVATTVVSEIDGGLPDSTALYQGGEPSSAVFSYTFNGGNP